MERERGSVSGDSLYPTAIKKKKYGKRAEISLYVIEHSEGKGDGAGNS